MNKNVSVRSLRAEESVSHDSGQSQAVSLAFEGDAVAKDEDIKTAPHATMLPGAELDLKRKLTQKSVFERINELKTTGRTSSPWVVELDPTTACNLACPDCISASLLNQGGFERERLRDLAEEMVEAGVRAVVLIGGGEPLVHPETPWIIKYFSEAGLHVGVTTNGTLIDRHVEILAEHTKWVRVSVDAGTEETFGHFRPAPNGKNRFNDVIKNIEEFAKLKKGKVGFSFLMITDVDEDGNVLKTNVGEIFQAAKIAKEIGCDYFEVKPTYDMKHYLLRQPKSVIETTKEQIELLAQLQGDGFRSITPKTLSYVLSDVPLLQPKSYTRCATAHMRTLITPKGVYVCPYFRGNENHNVGKVTTQSFTEMWSGEQREETMKNTDPSRDCPFHCIRHESNLILEKLIEEDETLDLVDDYDLFI